MLSIKCFLLFAKNKKRGVIMKKIGLALAFAAVIALSFAGCSNSSDSGAAAAAAAAAAATNEANNKQNTKQKAGDENAAVAETSVIKAEAVEGGIKITIKPFAGAVKNPLVRIVGTGAESSEVRLHPDWADGSVAWTCLYPYVTADKVYNIYLQADSGLAEQSLTLKASSGLGAIPKEGSVSVTVAADKISATVNDYAIADKIPGGIAGLTSNRTLLVFFAGRGWVPAENLWDGACITDFHQDIFNTSLEIASTDPVYINLKSNMTGTYNGKPLYVQSFYCFKKNGIPAEIRICCWETRVKSNEMAWN